MSKTTFFLLILSSASTCIAAEKSIQRSELPPAVEKALVSQLGGATIKSFSTERENGKQLYEAALLVDGHTKDIEFDSNGAVQEIEEEVKIDTLSPKVKIALAVKAKGRMVTKVESLRKHDAIVAYEAQVVDGENHSEITVGPNGESVHLEE